MTSTSTTLNKKAALADLKKRKKKNEPKVKNNANLYAGSPMYFYCRYCLAETDVLPESWDPRFTTPKKICNKCKDLKNRGLIS